MPRFLSIRPRYPDRSTLTILGLALALLLIVTLHDQGAIYQHALQLGMPETDAPAWLAWPVWANSAADWLIALGLTGSFALTLWWTNREQITPMLAVFVILVTLLATGILLTHPRTLSAGQAKNEETAYQLAQQAYRSGDYATASLVFERLYQYSARPAISLEALGWRSGALYQQHEYALSVMAACDYIRQATPDAHNYRANLITLHWAIYRLGQTATTLDESIARLDNLAACQGVSAASHLWLGISPGLYVAIHEAAQPGDNYLTPNSRATLQLLAERYAHEEDADLAWLALGEYDRLIQDYPTSSVLDKAYYHRAVRADQAGELDQARANYQAYIDHSGPTQFWTNTAIQRIGHILEEQHRPADALEYFITAGTVNDMTARYTMATTPWQFERDILYIIDVELTADDVRLFIEQHPDLPGSDALHFAWAANLMAEERYAAARAVFQQLCDTLPTTSRLQSLSVQNLSRLDVLQRAEKNSTPDAMLDVANYLTQPTPIIYNDLWNRGRRNAVLNRDTPWAYFLQHNDHLRAIRLLEKFLDQQPQHPRAEEATLMLAEAYRSLANQLAFLPVDVPIDFQVTALRRKAAEAYRAFIAHYPNSPRLSVALAATVLLYIERPPRESALARAQLRYISDHYPQHPFARQADHWIAYLDCAAAVEHTANTPAWLTAFHQAQTKYEAILAKSPDDTNAQQSIAKIDQFLHNSWMSRPGGVVPCPLPDR